MPTHNVTVRVECDHPDFDATEAWEWVVDHLGTGTDARIGRMANLVGVGQFMPPEDEDNFVPVKWEVRD